METTTIQKIKKAAGKLFEPRQLDAGLVLEVRFWEMRAIVEIDLHLPQINMHDWAEVPYIKFKVDDLTYRDYTPSCWDADTSTCTLFIDTAHKGAGCIWAINLKKDDAVYYLKTGTSNQQPDGVKTVIALGDESSLGHLLALQQMTLPITRFAGAVVLNNEHNCSEFAAYFKSPLQALIRKDKYGHNTLMQWALTQHYTLNDVVFYLTGNNTMVDQLRKMLRQQGYTSAQIKVKGFWS